MGCLCAELILPVAWMYSGPNRDFRRQFWCFYFCLCSSSQAIRNCLSLFHMGPPPCPPACGMRSPFCLLAPSTPHSERAEAGGVWQSAPPGIVQDFRSGQRSPSRGQSYWWCSWALAGGLASWAQCGGISEFTPLLCHSAAPCQPVSSGLGVPGHTVGQGRSQAEEGAESGCWVLGGAGCGLPTADAQDTACVCRGPEL